MFRRKSKDNDTNISPTTSDSSKHYPLELMSAYVANEEELLKSMNSLIKAVYSGDHKKFQELILKKKVDLSATDRFYKRTVLHWAAMQQSPGFLEGLIKYGVTPEDLLRKDADERIPLSIVRDPVFLFLHIS
jgi:hypothetical protein